VALDDVAADGGGVAGLERARHVVALFQRGKLGVVEVFDFRLEAARLEMSDPGAAASSRG